MLELVYKTLNSWRPERWVSPEKIRETAPGPVAIKKLRLDLKKHLSKSGSKPEGK